MNKLIDAMTSCSLRGEHGNDKLMSHHDNDHRGRDWPLRGKNHLLYAIRYKEKTCVYVPSVPNTPTNILISISFHMPPCPSGSLVIFLYFQS